MENPGEEAFAVHEGGFGQKGDETEADRADHIQEEGPGLSKGSQQEAELHFEPDIGNPEKAAERHTLGGDAGRPGHSDWRAEPNLLEPVEKITSTYAFAFVSWPRLVGPG